MKGVRSTQCSTMSMTHLKIVDAESLFKDEDPNNKGFAFMQCQNLLRHQPKWTDKERELNVMTTPTNGQDVECNTPEQNTLEKPMGTKRAKGTLNSARDNRYVKAVEKLWEKKKVTDDEKFAQLCELEKDHVQKMMQFKQKEIGLREKEAAAKEKKAAAKEKEATTREMEAAARLKEAEAMSQEAQRKHMLDEERIMTIHLSSSNAASRFLPTVAA